MDARVLVIVLGGVVYHVSDPGIEVVIVDFDEVEAGGKLAEIPASFSDLSQDVGLRLLNGDRPCYGPFLR